MGRIYEAVEAFMKADDWPVQQLDGQTIVMTSFKGKKGEFKCFVQAREPQEHLLVYAVMPALTPEDRREAMAGFLARANYDLPIGNFEMDYTDGEVRFKTSMDFEDVDIQPLMLRNLIYANVLSMDKYLPGLMSVAFGGASGAEAIAQVES